LRNGKESGQFVGVTVVGRGRGGEGEVVMAASFAEERRAAIMSMLDRDASVQVADIASAFGVSRVTARADLDALERDGKLRRTHGGAVSLSKTLTVSIQDQRVNVNVAAKQAIARAALRFVHDGDAILVDSGTTALELVRALGSRDGVTVVTGDFTISDFVDRSLPRTDVVMLGGALRKGHRYTYGPLALRSLEALHPTSAFLCPTSYVPGRGLMTNYAAMAELKAAFLSCAEHRYVLMDASKVGAPGLLRFGDLSGVEAVVMDADPDGAVAADLERLGRAGDLILAGE
jgi:DeoR/GlpR family transcriptional regulator of sugar metabolism